MSRNQTAGLVLVLIVLIAAGVVYYEHNKKTAQNQRIPPQDTHYTAPAALSVRHTVVAGAETYSGTFPIRPCNTFSSGHKTAGSEPAHVQLNFTVLDGDGTCQASRAAEDTQQPYSLSFSTTAKQTKPSVLDSVILNGKAIPYTVVEN
jgi:hypothetical protein